MDQVDFFEGLGQPKSYIPTDKLTPVHADVTLRLEFQEESDDIIRGCMVLELQVIKSTSRLVLHGNGLEIESCRALENGKEAFIACNTWELDAPLQMIAFTFERPLPRGRATVEITWTVNVSAVPPRQPGFWGGLFVRHEGEHLYHHMTQFEPCNARTAYPCFDQPCTKQTFRLTLSHIPVGLTALSNTEATEEVVDDADPRFKTVTFGRTSPTPAYLTAWVVGRFRVWQRTLRLPDYSDNNSRTALLRNLTARVLICVDHEDADNVDRDGAYALELVCAALEFFTSQFRVNYPYGRLDNVATPLQPLLGMENWGLITYREGFLDVTTHSPADRRKRIARLVGHEVVHQWFGNSTSVSWWSFLFLKEGFARLLEYVFVDQLRPEWNYWHHFQSDIYHPVLIMDEAVDTHPILQTIDYPKQIFENVDTICYGKGAAVLRMLWAYLEAPTFFRGLQVYLGRYRDKCVSPSALWDAFSSAYSELHPRTTIEPLNVALLVRQWVESAGHPEIHVYRDSSTRAFMVEQRVAGGLNQLQATVPRDSEGRSLWHIPLVTRSGQRGREHRFIMSRGRQHFAELDDEGPVLMNAGATGFFRVKYDESVLEAIVERGALEWMTELELCNLYQDTMHFALCGELILSAQLVVRLTLLVLVRVESHYLWQLALPYVARLLEELEGTDALGHVCCAIREPVNRMYGVLPAEFVERGKFRLLEEVLVRVSVALDPWVLQLQASAEEALMRLAQDGAELSKAQLAPLYHVVGLWIRCPDCAAEASASVMALLEDPECPAAIRPKLDALRWQVGSLEVLRTMLEPIATQEELEQVLISHQYGKGVRRLSRAVRDCCVRRKLPVIGVAEAIDQGTGATMRTAFRGYRYRRPTLGLSRGSGFVTAAERDSSSQSPRKEDSMSYLPLTQYVTLAVVVLGAGALGFAAYKTWFTSSSSTE